MPILAQVIPRVEAEVAVASTVAKWVTCPESVLTPDRAAEVEEVLTKKIVAEVAEVMTRKTVAEVADSVATTMMKTVELADGVSKKAMTPSKHSRHGAVSNRIRHHVSRKRPRETGVNRQTWKCKRRSTPRAGGAARLLSGQTTFLAAAGATTTTSRPGMNGAVTTTTTMKEERRQPGRRGPMRAGSEADAAGEAEAEAVGP